MFFDFLQCEPKLILFGFFKNVVLFLPDNLDLIHFEVNILQFGDDFSNMHNLKESKK